MLHLQVIIKNFFFGNSFIEIRNQNNDIINLQKILVSDGNKVLINNKKHKTRLSNEKILKTIYPNS